MSTQSPQPYTGFSIAIVFLLLTIAAFVACGQPSDTPTPESPSAPTSTPSPEATSGPAETPPQQAGVTGPAQSPETALPTVPIALPEGVVTYTYHIVNSYPHDRYAYTQGLAFADGMLYEGTGWYGESSLRKVDPTTGNVLQLRELPPKYFGEGVAVFDDLIVQLTWRSRLGFVYERSSFEPLRQFFYATEGWGITHNGENLIMSDGTATLYFLDPETFQVTGDIKVTDDGLPVNYLNELEYINGQIYANVWTTDRIAIIDPDDGRVASWIDLAGLLPAEYLAQTDVLNGIAYDTAHDRLFVTGKLWPYLFEITLIPATEE